jgi:hypothetical protein
MIDRNNHPQITHAAIIRLDTPVIRTSERSPPIAKAFRPGVNPVVLMAEDCCGGLLHIEAARGIEHHVVELRDLIEMEVAEMNNLIGRLQQRDSVGDGGLGRSTEPGFRSGREIDHRDRYDFAHRGRIGFAFDGKA